MPNHVTNIIEIKGDPARIKALFAAIKNDEYGLGSIDFNKLIPMPPELGIEEGSQTKRGLKAYKDFIEVYTFNGKKENYDLSHIPEKAEQAFLRVRPDIDSAAWELGKKAFQNQQRWGFTTWYGFCTNQWGTKWNAYGYDNGVQFDGKSLRFLTAWAPPTPIMTKLAQMYPDLDFTHKWADEDIGYNCGEVEYHNGVPDGEFFPVGQEAVDYANSLWGNDGLEEDEEIEESEDMGGPKL
jgi:hypothetical protein